VNAPEPAVVALREAVALLTAALAWGEKEDDEAAATTVAVGGGDRAAFLPAADADAAAADAAAMLVVEAAAALARGAGAAADDDAAADAGGAAAINQPFDTVDTDDAEDGAPFLVAAAAGIDMPGGSPRRSRRSFSSRSRSRASISASCGPRKTQSSMEARNKMKRWKILARVVSAEMDQCAYWILLIKKRVQYLGLPLVLGVQVCEPLGLGGGTLVGVGHKLPFLRVPQNSVVPCHAFRLLQGEK
jgi:hypothetical protein